MNARHAALLARRRALRIAQTPRVFANWPSVLADLGREPLGRGPQSLEFVARTGLRLRCPNRPGARVPIYELLAEDCYRLDWFLGPLRERPLGVLDIGGHVGAFACALAWLHPQATVRSYEPSPTTAEYLRGNVRRNGLDARIEVREAAVAATAGTATFEDNGAASGMNGLVSAGHRASGSIEVATTTFDAEIAAAPAQLVKIDCEGGEYGLVEASDPASWSGVERVVLEYHPVAGRSWPELRRWFEAAGLTVWADEPIAPAQGTAWLGRGPAPRA